MAEEKIVTNPIKAIRMKCLDCCCGSGLEVELCTVTRCPLYPFRHGKNPYRTHRDLTDEEKQKRRENLEKARAAMKENRETK